MRIYFKSNLDEVQRDVCALNALNLDMAADPIPRVGERIDFSFIRGPMRCTYGLEVYDVTYHYGEKDRRIDVELHIPSYQKSMSIAEWMSWFKRHRFGDSV